MSEVEEYKYRLNIMYRCLYLLYCGVCYSSNLSNSADVISLISVASNVHNFVFDVFLFSFCCA